MAIDLRGRLASPIDAASLAVFRIVFGSVLLIGVVRFFAFGWIDQFFVQPSFFFSYFSWLKPLPAWGMYALYAGMGCAALGIALGCYYRVSVVFFFVAFTYAELLDKTNYLNHYYFITLAAGLMCWMPLHRMASIDAIRKPEIRSEVIPAWCLWILRFQLGVVYFFAGFAKLNADWLFRAEPIQTWLASRSDLPLVGALLAEPGTAYLFSWLGAAFDLTVPFFLLHRRTRPYAYIAVVGFHLFTGMLFKIGLFPWVMIGATLLFFPPEWPRVFFRTQTASANKRPHEPLPGPAFALLAVYIIVQVLVPFRFLHYSGNVLWTEKGFRFAWRVMLTEKTGHVRFIIKEKENGAIFEIHPRDHLTRQQVVMMSTQPDMIHDYARFLAKTYQQKLGTEVSVNAIAYASLNGRPSVPLIDPRVDLASATFGFTRGNWILPEK